MENDRSMTFDIPRRALVRGVVVTCGAAIAGYVVGRNVDPAGSTSAAANGHGREAAAPGRPPPPETSLE